FFFSSRRRHTRSYGDWSSDVCSSDLAHKAKAGDLAQRLLADQRQRWQAGESIRVEAYLTQQPDLLADRDAVLDLLYNEFLLRERSEERRVGKEGRGRRAAGVCKKKSA